MKRVIKLIACLLLPLFSSVCDTGSGNIPPVAVIDGELKTYINEPLILDGTKSMDPDGDTLSFFWELTSAPSGSEPVLSDEDSSTPLFITDKEGPYEVTLIVSDGKEKSKPETHKILVFKDNVTPIADAGEDRYILITDTINLDGRMSADPQNNPLTFTWSFKTMPENSNAEIENANSPIARFKPDLPHTTYEIQLVVSNEIYESEPDTILVNILNTLPVAEAGPNQYVHPGDVVALHGSGTDIDGDEIKSYAWEIISKPGNNSFLSSPEAQDTLLYTDPDAIGDYIIALKVFDGMDWSEQDSIVISNINAPPVVDAGSDRDSGHCFNGSLYVATNSAQPDCNYGNWGYLKLNGVAFDPEGDPLTFNWEVISKPPSAPQPQIISPASLETLVKIESSSPVILGDFVFRLTATDKYEATSYDEIKVRVTNRAPISGGCIYNCTQSVTRSGCTAAGSLCYTQPLVTFNGITLKAEDPDRDPLYPEIYRSTNDNGLNCIEGSNTQCNGNNTDCLYSVTLKAYFLACSNTSTWAGTSKARLKFKDGFNEYYNDAFDDITLSVYCQTCN